MSFPPGNICTLQYLITEETYSALGLFLSLVMKDSLLSEKKDSQALNQDLNINHLGS